MTATDFNSLSLSTKSALLREKGSHLCERTTSLYKVWLFGMNEFYVEVYFTYDMDRIESIRLLEDRKQLEQYLPLINLPIDML